MQNLTYSAAGLAFTQHFEGVRLESYQDEAGVWTIGYGHTGPDVTPRMKITERQAATLLLKDLACATSCVNERVTVALSQNQFDALVDFTFNAGKTAFEESTLLRMLNAGNFGGAAAQFSLWVHAKGQAVPGLVRRRAEEAALFNTIVASSDRTTSETSA